MNRGDSAFVDQTMLGKHIQPPMRVRKKTGYKTEAVSVPLDLHLAPNCLSSKA